MITVSVHEAGTHLSRLIDQVLAGQEVTVTRDREPVIRLVRVTPPEKKPLLGAMKGQFTVDDSFFDPLPPEELAAWNGERD